MADEVLNLANSSIAVVVQPSGMQAFNIFLDKFLSVAIPLIIFGVFGYMMYTAFQDPIDRLIAWIKSKFADNDTGESTSTPRYSGISIDSRAEIYR